MGIVKFVLISRTAVGALALPAALACADAAMAESLAAGEMAARTATIAQTEAQNALGSGDPRFRNQFRAWQAYDTPGSPAMARISIYSASSSASIAVQTNSDRGTVTFGRALDAEGLAA